MGNRTYEGVMALVEWRAKSVSGLRAHQTLFSCVPWSRITLTIGWCEIPRANGERPQMLPNVVFYIELGLRHIADSGQIRAENGPLYSVPRTTPTTQSQYLI
jgi:hypothetical protein